VNAAHRHACRHRLVDAALRKARVAGFEFVETNWRVTNRRRELWLDYGFEATYVRLHRTIGSVSRAFRLPYEDRSSGVTWRERCTRRRTNQELLEVPSDVTV